MAKKSFTIPIKSLERYLKLTIAHLPERFEVTSVSLAHHGHVKFTVEPSVPEGEAEHELAHHPHLD